MSREQNLKAIIIKKQPLGEADEIITFITQELGKVRALAKSVKLAKSKLQQFLQPIFLNNIVLAGQGSLPKIIRVQTLETFSVLQDSPERVSVWFVVAELLNRALPDEQKNELLFKYLVKFLEFLNSEELDSNTLQASLVRFKIHFLELIGLAIQSGGVRDAGSGVWFSAERGGFFAGSSANAGRNVTASAWKIFSYLQKPNFLETQSDYDGLKELSELVNHFIAYQLEREIKSDRFLKS